MSPPWVPREGSPGPSSQAQVASRGRASVGRLPQRPCPRLVMSQASGISRTPLGLPWSSLGGSQAGEDWTAPEGCPSPSELTCAGAPPRSLTATCGQRGHPAGSSSPQTPWEGPSTFPLGLWQLPGWTPQVLASLPGLGPPPGCTSLSPGVCAGSGILVAPPDSATLPGAVLGPPGHVPEVSVSAVPSQEFWLTFSGAARTPGATGPPQTASPGSWDEGLLCSYVGLVPPASWGAWLPEDEVRGWVRLQAPGWVGSV